MAVKGGVCCEEKEEGTGTMHDGNPPKRSSITEILDDGAAEEDADTDAKIPAGEEGGVGRASLVIGGYADDHVLECWPEVTIAQANEDGGTIITYYVGTGDEEQIADGRGDDADASIVDEPPLTQHLASLQT